MKLKIKNSIKTLMPFMFIIKNGLFFFLFIIILHLGISGVGLLNVRTAHASDTSFLTNVNNPNVLIFLDTSGSMMWNKDVFWKNSSSYGYDKPESWARTWVSKQGQPPRRVGSFVWAPGSNSMFSKIYNAKYAISKILNSSEFSNLNFAFASFQQAYYYNNSNNNNSKSRENMCVYSDDESFQNSAAASYYAVPGTTADGTPDETGRLEAFSNKNYPFALFYYGGSGNNYILTLNNYLDYNYNGWRRVSINGFSGCPNTINSNGTTYYFISYDYSGEAQAGEPFISWASPWVVYVPLSVDGTLNPLNNKDTVPVPKNAKTANKDPYFEPPDIASKAINWLLWKAPIYGSNALDPNGNVISGLKAGGGTPTSDSVADMYGYFKNSLSADSAKGCRRNFSIIITDGEANSGCMWSPLDVPSSPLSITTDEQNRKLCHVGKYGATAQNGIPSSETPQEVYDLYNLDTKYPIELFIIGFGYANNIGSGTYIQEVANAGVGINPGTINNPVNLNGIQNISATVKNSAGTLLQIPHSLFKTTNKTTNKVEIGDTISDNNWQSSDCETNYNDSNAYKNGDQCATITAIYPNFNEILLSNSLKSPTNGLTLSGTVYLAYNLNELESSLTTIFNQIEKKTASFTSPVVNETSNQQYVYYTNFKSLNQPLWGEGNVYLFGLNSQDQLVGPLGPAVGTNGQINTGDSYWDNGNGAGALLKSEHASSRNVLTSYLHPSTGTQQTIAINPVSTSSGNSNLDNMLNISASSTSPDYYGTICTGSTSVSACATDILNFVLDPDSSTDHWKLGAIFHSSPVLVGPPPFPYSSSSYQAFKQEYAVTNPRNEVLYVGANDGMLHAFNAGSWDSSTKSYTYGTGAEVFGYIPPNLLPKITAWYDSSIGVGTKLNFPEFVDSTPDASDVFFNNIFPDYVSSGTPTTESPDVNSDDNSEYPINQNSLQNSWHSVLIGGERNGGTYYYALGVTNPLSSSYPDPLWNITDSSMGNTWSKPYISYVCLPNPDYSKTKGETGECGNNPDPGTPLLPPQYIKTYAAFVGGGYSPNSTNKILGNALYALYTEPNPVNTGTPASPDYADEQILWEFPSANDLNSNMKYSIPSAVTPVLSQNFRMEGFYAGDLGGQMWSVNIPDGSAPYTSKGKSNWDACRVFDSDASTSEPLNIFFSPATATDTLGNFWIFFGTGNREDLNAPSKTRDNEFIAINTTPLGGPLSCPSGGPINESDLVNQTGVSGSTKNLSTVQSADGWYITLSKGERVTSAPVVYDGVVYFTTFTPSSVDDACGNGTSRLYALSYLNGGGAIVVSTSGTISIVNNATSSSGAVQSTVVGSGVASAPTITNDYLGITTSTGKVFRQKIPALPSKVTPTSWFEEP
jgi:hypothetical protein